MQSSFTEKIIQTYCQTHNRIGSLVDKMTDAQLHWRPTAESHSIAFHVWHVSRWADYMQAAIPGMTPELKKRLGARVQIWESEDLAAHWGFPADQLGYAQTGMEMSDDVVRELRFPAKTDLLAYARQAFAAVEQVVAAIDEQQFHEAEQPQPITEGIWSEGAVGGAIVDHISHDNRHLGVIECLYGIQVGSGTATV